MHPGANFFPLCLMFVSFFLFLLYYNSLCSARNAFIFRYIDMYKRLILVLFGSCLFLWWSWWAQFVWTWLFSDTLDFGETLDVVLGSDKEIISTEIVLSVGETGQIMTGLDTGNNLASWLSILDTDSTLLSGLFYQNLEVEEFTGEIYSGIVVPWTGQIFSDPISRLLLSEVYYDGTDEWIEITNIGEGTFQGNILLSWVKSTPVSLTNIFLLSGESKIFGDILAQISWTSFVGKTGLALSIADTAAIQIQLVISGQIVDSFSVDQYWVNKYNDKKISFEKVGETPTRVQSNRITQAQSGYTINPGKYFGTGINVSNVSLPWEQDWVNLQPPISCDFVDQRDLIKINEIFPWNEKYPPYIELAIHENIALNSLSLSGNLLGTGIEFSWNDSGTTLENNSLLLISATGFWQSENLQSVRNGDFYLLSTWNRLLITIGSWQNRQVMDIIYLSWNMLGSSSYFNATSQQCVRIFDYLDDFSPGFEQKFLKYFPLTTVTKIEYIEITTGNQSEITNCPVVWEITPSSWDISMSATGSLVPDDYTLHILAIDYDPDGSDTNNEKITLLATSNVGNPAPLDLSKLFRLKVNGTNKTLPWILAMDTPTTFTKTFGFPNSTASGQDVIITLNYGDYIFDTYTYNPKKFSPQEENQLTSTGYTVSSVLDGDTLRIKYEGKTQSVRLLGIDAPESSKTRYKHLECFGSEAKNHLKSLVDKKKITFQFDPSQDQKDLYDRLLAYVYLDGELINQTMLEQGYAKEYTYKTPYRYQAEFKQAEQSAHEQALGLWSEKTCGVSLSGVQLTGDIESTGTVLFISWWEFTITYVLPNPKGSDKFEEMGLLISNRDDFLPSQEWRTGTSTEDLVPSTVSQIPQSTSLVPSFDLSQGFTLRVGKTKKKIHQIVHIGQENILSWSLGLVNKAACVAFFYEEQELTKFCYTTPKEGQKIYASDSWLASTPQENLDILNTLQLKRIGNKLCIWYKEQSFLCKRIPASKAEIKATQEQKLYKWFATLIKQYIINNWKTLYYETPLKTYFDLVAHNKKLIASGVFMVDIYGQRVSVTDTKKQIAVLETTPPIIVALFKGFEVLMSEMK